MEFEIILVTGLVLAALSVVALMNALIEGKRPRVAAFSTVVSVGILAWAAQIADEEFRIADIPEAFVIVVAAIFN